MAVVGPRAAGPNRGRNGVWSATVFSYGLNGYTSVRARKQAQEQEKMPDPTVVGIDISKTHLDTYMAPAGKAARFTNDSAGFKALIAWIDQPVRSVVYEPTGPWHRAFEEALLQAGLPLARANPLQARRFAQAMGQRAKTRRRRRAGARANGDSVASAADRGVAADAPRPRGTAGGARRAGHGPHRRTEPPEAPSTSAVEAAEQDAAVTD